ACRQDLSGCGLASSLGAPRANDDLVSRAAHDVRGSDRGANNICPGSVDGWYADGRDADGRTPRILASIWAFRVGDRLGTCFCALARVDDHARRLGSDGAWRDLR